MVRRSDSNMTGLAVRSPATCILREPARLRKTANLKYDEMGRVIEMDEPRGVTTLSYDSENRVIQFSAGRNDQLCLRPGHWLEDAHLDGQFGHLLRL